MKLYTFNGQQLTSAQIHALVPAFCISTLLDHIRKGRDTTEAILCHVPKRPKPAKASQFMITSSRGNTRQAPSKMR